MIISCIPHCSYFTPAITMCVLQYIRARSLITKSPCNTVSVREVKQYYNYLSLTKQEDSVVHSIPPDSIHWPGQPGGGDLLPVRAGSEELSGGKIIVTIRATSHHQNLSIGSL